MRLVRDFGTFDQLLPPHITDVRDLPYPLFGALKHAGLVLSWDELLSSEERPPRRIWLDGKQLNEWFDDVKRKREREMKGDGLGPDPMENEAAKGLIVGG